MEREKVTEGLEAAEAEKGDLGSSDKLALDGNNSDNFDQKPGDIRGYVCDFGGLFFLIFIFFPFFGMCLFD